MTSFKLHDLCELGDLYGVNTYLSKLTKSQLNDQLHQSDSYHMTPLHITLMSGRPLITMVLLSYGADFDMDCEGTPFVHMLFMLCGAFPRYQRTQIPFQNQNNREQLDLAICQENNVENDLIAAKQQTEVSPQQLQQQCLKEITKSNDLSVVNQQTEVSSQQSQPQSECLKCNDKSYGHYILSLLFGLQFMSQFQQLTTPSSPSTQSISTDNTQSNNQIPSTNTISTHINHTLQLGSDIITLQQYSKNEIIQLFMKVDDVDRNIFHICAMYDLAEYFELIIYYFMYNDNNINQTNNTNISTNNFVEQLFKLLIQCDLAGRSTFHYIAQYRSIKMLNILQSLLFNTTTTNENIIKFTTMLSQWIDVKKQFCDEENCSAMDYVYFFSAYQYTTPVQLLNDKFIQQWSKLVLHNDIAFKICVGSDVQLDQQHDQLKVNQQGACTNNNNNNKNINNTTSININYIDFSHHSPRLQLPFEYGCLNLSKQSSTYNTNINSTTSTSQHQKPLPLGIFYSPRCFEHINTPLLTRNGLNSSSSSSYSPENVQRLRLLLNSNNGTLLQHVQPFYDNEYLQSMGSSTSSPPSLSPSSTSSPSSLTLIRMDQIIHNNDNLQTPNVKFILGERKAMMVDILRVHEYEYIAEIMKRIEMVVDLPERFEIPININNSCNIINNNNNHDIVNSNNNDDIVNSNNSHNIIHVPYNEDNDEKSIVLNNETVTNSDTNINVPELTQYKDDNDVNVDVKMDNDDILSSFTYLDQWVPQCHKMLWEQTPIHQPLSTELTNTLQNCMKNRYENDITNNELIDSINATTSTLTLTHTKLNQHHLTTSNLTQSTYSPQYQCHIPYYLPSLKKQLSPLDWETMVCGYSFIAAQYAAGTILQAIDSIFNFNTNTATHNTNTINHSHDQPQQSQSQYKSAFIPIRPPGHHTGSLGVISNDYHFDDSLGFCLLNNIAIAAAYAKSKQPTMKICIIDFDVHHGNGTEDIIKNLLPRYSTLNLPCLTAEEQQCERMAYTKYNNKINNINNNTNHINTNENNNNDNIKSNNNQSQSIPLQQQQQYQQQHQQNEYKQRLIYKPWYDLHRDVDDILFISTHGYNTPLIHEIDNDIPEKVFFYPGTGQTNPKLKELIQNENCNSMNQIIPPLLSTIPNDNNNIPNNQQSSSMTTSTLLPIHDNPIYSTSITAQMHSISTLQSLRTQQQIDYNSLFQSDTSHLVSISRLDSILLEEQNQQQQNQQLSSTTTTKLQKTSKILNHGFGCNTNERIKWREAWLYGLLPSIIAHQPDLILISAGFDGHQRDYINDGYLGLNIFDYEWLTMKLCQIANLFYNCKIISILEGGYQIHGGTLISPYVQAVNAHVQVLKQFGGMKYDFK